MMAGFATPTTPAQQQGDVRASTTCGLANGWVSCLPTNVGTVHDISDEAVWSLSSCKEGLGVHQLLDDRPDSYWQSDGLQPHTITIEFQRKTDISFIVIYLDYKSDESYTPSKIQVQTGSSILDLDEPKVATFNEPSGWKLVDLRQQNDSKRPVRAFVVQIQVLQNHQNGRDTHIRGLRVLGSCNPRTHYSKRELSQENEQLSRQLEEPDFTRSIFGCMIR